MSYQGMHKISGDKAQPLTDTVQSQGDSMLRSTEYGSRGRSLAGPLSLLQVPAASITANNVPCLSFSPFPIKANIFFRFH